ncbi:MAG: S26 family signal peptidase [Firmicutes bacterium]|nr:S26 family signal peptidase [Bacillota bacterium]
MIYKHSYFSKELRQGYTENIVSSKQRVVFALFLGLISFAVFFAAQPLRESVLLEAIPQIMQPSYFSTLYIYIHVALVLNIFYYILNYDSLFFYEIKQNSWYLLVKMGYNPLTMIFSKLTALLLSTIFVYTIGFFFTAFMTYFLKYSLIPAYFPSLYLAGLIDLIIMIIISMTLSTFVKSITGARYFIAFSFILLIILKIKLGYYSILSNRVAMQNLYNLFDIGRSPFLPAAAAIVSVFILVCIVMARNISKYYYLPDTGYDGILTPGERVVLIDPKTGRGRALGNGKRQARRRKIFDVASVSFLILFILAALSFNLVILAINASTLGREVSFRGTIPYIFKSSTMEPEIMLNDLVYFKQIEPDDKVEVGQIILFEEHYVTYVERVIGIEKGLYRVDIDNYPPLSETGAMIKTVDREAIRGIYSGRNRWLGALILFANTIFGRLLFLLIPAILLFYHRPITERTKQLWLN